MSNLRKQLKELAQLSILANKISEIQAKNLKMFPFVFFETLEEASLEYDLGHGSENKEVKHKSLVTYHLTIKDLEVNESIGFDKRCKALEHAVRELFWTDIKVTVYVNQKNIYESKDE